MNFSIIIFCFNEEGSILDVFHKVHALLLSFATDFEIILVNDGSTDSTGTICEGIAAQHTFVKLITHSQNLGIGMALRNGYLAAQKEYVCAIPGDGQFAIEELKMTQPFSSKMYYSFYRPQTNYSFYRKVLSWLNRLFNQHILGIYLRDVNWIKVYRNEQLKQVNHQLKSSLIESEICAKLYKMKVMPIEIPSAYLPRQWGIAKGGNWNTLRQAIAETLQLIGVVSRFKP